MNSNINSRFQKANLLPSSMLKKIGEKPEKKEDGAKPEVQDEKKAPEKQDPKTLKFDADAFELIADRNKATMKIHLERVLTPESKSIQDSQAEGSRGGISLDEDQDQVNGDTQYAKGDVNHDGVVDVADISAVINAMAEDGTNTQYDVNGDGSVDIADISAVSTIMANGNDAIADAGLIEAENVSIIDCDSNINVVKNYLSAIFPELFEQGIFDDELCKQLGIRAKMFLFQNRGVSNLSDETIIQKCLEAQAQLASEAIMFGFDVGDYINRYLALQMDFVCPIETVAGARGMSSITGESEVENNNQYGLPDYVIKTLDDIYGINNYEIISTSYNGCNFGIYSNGAFKGDIFYNGETSSGSNSQCTITLKLDELSSNKIIYDSDGNQTINSTYIDVHKFYNVLKKESSLTPEERKYFTNGIDDIYEYITKDPNLGFELIDRYLDFHIERDMYTIFDKSLNELGCLLLNQLLNNLEYTDLLRLYPKYNHSDLPIYVICSTAKARYNSNSKQEQNTNWNYDGILFNQTANQGATGDCYLLSTLFSVSQNTEFNAFINSIVKIDMEKGTYTVTLHGKEYTYTIEELISASELTIGGDLDVRAFEMALRESLAETGNRLNSGYVSKVLLAFLGCKKDFQDFDKDMCSMGIQSIMGSDYRDDNIEPEQALEQIRSGEYMSFLTGGIGYDKYGEKISLSYEHAYSIIGCDDKYVYIIDPYHNDIPCDGSNVIKVTLEDFKGKSQYRSIKVSDFIDIVQGKNEKMNQYLEQLQESLIESDTYLSYINLFNIPPSAPPLRLEREECEEWLKNIPLDFLDGNNISNSEGMSDDEFAKALQDILNTLENNYYSNYQAACGDSNGDYGNGFEVTVNADGTFNITRSIIKPRQSENPEESENPKETEKQQEQNNGYDSDGYDKDGYDRNGYDRDGYDRDGYDRNGFNRYGERKGDSVPDVGVVFPGGAVQSEESQGEDSKGSQESQGEQSGQNSQGTQGTQGTQGQQGEQSGQDTQRDETDSNNTNNPIFGGKTSSSEDVDSEFDSPEEEEEFINNTLEELNGKISDMYKTPPCTISDKGETAYPYDLNLIDVESVTTVGEGLSNNMGIGDYVYRANLKAALKDFITKILGQLAKAGIENSPQDLDNKTLTELGSILKSLGISWEHRFDNGVIIITYDFSFESPGELSSEYKDGYQVWIKGYCFKFLTDPTPHWEFDEESTINGQ